MNKTEKETMTVNEYLESLTPELDYDRYIYEVKMRCESDEERFSRNRGTWLTTRIPDFESPQLVRKRKAYTYYIDPRAEDLPLQEGDEYCSDGGWKLIRNSGAGYSVGIDYRRKVELEAKEDA